MRMTNNLLITGGCGFIGSAFIRYLLRLKQPIRIVNLDLLTSAADQSNLDGFHENPRYRFIQGDINNVLLVDQLLSEYEIDVVVHFASRDPNTTEHLLNTLFRNKHHGDCGSAGSDSKAS